MKGALTDPRFYAGAIVAILIMYGLQYMRAMKAKAQ